MAITAITLSRSESLAVGVREKEIESCSNSRKTGPTVSESEVLVSDSVGVPFLFSLIRHVFLETMHVVREIALLQIRR